MKSARRNIWPAAHRRLVSFTVLLALCAMLVPLPLAVRPPQVAEKDQSQPFPCQHRPCGCQSADQCWKSCCCFSHAQKIAWANAHGVRVPDFVFPLAAQEAVKSAGASSHAIAARARNLSADCCTHTSVAASPSPAFGKPTCLLEDRSSLPCQTGSPRAQCCSPGAPDGAEADPATTSKASWLTRCWMTGVIRRISNTWQSDQSVNPGISASRDGVTAATSLPQRARGKHRWVLSMFAAECQGQGFSLCSWAAAILPVLPKLAVDPSVDRETCEIVSHRLPHCALQPPLPPPKIV